MIINMGKQACSAYHIPGIVLNTLTSLIQTPYLKAANPMRVIKFYFRVRRKRLT